MDPYEAAHRHRLCWMPWLWDRRTPAQACWAEPWQAEYQARIAAVEQVRFGDDVFIADPVHVFAEPKRPIIVGDRCRIGAEVYLHGPIELGPDVSINPRCHLEGSSGGIRIGAGSRLAAGVRIYAFEHGLVAGIPIREQPVTGEGVSIGADCWLGAGSGVVDGVSIGDGAVVGMGAVVTRDVAPGVIVAGVPARPIGTRRG